MIPKFGSKEWFAWKVKFVAEAYAVLERNYNREQLKPRQYDPIYARRKP